MTEEDFLKRWSRRKREVAEAEKPTPEAEPTRAVAAANDQAVQEPREKPSDDFDPASLPPIDSINAVSDITAFLRAGVPPELTRAALRRVWTADPAIREFVGLAENAWDFTDPNAMPGFGPLESTEEVRQMIANLVGRIGRAAQPVSTEITTENTGIAENSNDSSVVAPAEEPSTGRSETVCATERAPQTVAQNLGNQVLVQGTKENIAAQHDAAEDLAEPKQMQRHSHGGALPR